MAIANSLVPNSQQLELLLLVNSNIRLTFCLFLLFLLSSLPSYVITHSPPNHHQHHHHRRFHHCCYCCRHWHNNCHHPHLLCLRHERPRHSHCQRYHCPRPRVIADVGTHKIGGHEKRLINLSPRHRLEILDFHNASSNSDIISFNFRYSDS